MSLNKITLSGNLGADAELRYTKSGNPVVSFSLAVNERTPNGDGSWGEYTNWPDCVMFGKRAEALAPWLRFLGASTRAAIRRTARASSAGKCALMTWS